MSMNAKTQLHKHSHSILLFPLWPLSASRSRRCDFMSNCRSSRGNGELSTPQNSFQELATYKRVKYLPDCCHIGMNVVLVDLYIKTFVLTLEHMVTFVRVSQQVVVSVKIMKQLFAPVGLHWAGQAMGPVWDSRHDRKCKEGHQKTRSPHGDVCDSEEKSKVKNRHQSPLVISGKSIKKIYEKNCSPHKFSFLLPSPKCPRHPLLGHPSKSRDNVFLCTKHAWRSSFPTPSQHPIAPIFILFLLNLFLIFKEDILSFLAMFLCVEKDGGFLYRQHAGPLFRCFGLLTKP